MQGALGSIVSIVALIVGVAILAVLVSKNAQTPQVIASAGQALAQDLQAATAPVTGGGGLSTFGSFTGSPIL
jgi:hypothetical protein